MNRSMAPGARFAHNRLLAFAVARFGRWCSRAAALMLAALALLVFAVMMAPR